MSSKKKDKGKKKGEKSKKEPKEAPEPVLEVVDETSKQFFLLQIKDLEEKLTRYQKKSDELEILVKKYEGEYEALSNDKKDIISNLKKELERKADEILDLNDRLVGLQQAKDAEKEAFEKQLTDLRTEYQETKDNLTNQNNTLLAKLAALDEFRTQKEDLLAKLTELEQRNEQLEKEHQEKLYEVEKKVVLDKDRLKKEMIVRVNQVAADFRRVSNKQMADTTKRTIRENVSINAQLQKMSEKIVEIVNDNDRLAKTDKDDKQQIEILEDNEKKLAKKNVSNIKILRMLTDKCKSQEVIIAELEEKFNEMQESEAKSAELAEELMRINETLKVANDRNDDLEKLVKELKHDVDSFQHYRNKIEKVLKEATHSLILALSKNASIAKKASLKNIKTEEKEEKEEDWNDIEIRDNMLENLLILLNSAATLGFGPELQDFSSQGYHRPRTSEFPGSGKGLRKNQVPLTKTGHGTSGINPHYDLGDLGIVPRKNEHVLTNIEKMKIIHPQKELGTLQRVTRKSVSTQTLDATKASVFNKFELSEEKPENNLLEPFFENTNKKGVNKSQVLMPITATNRVTNRVF